MAPRPEDVPPAEAAVEQAKARLDDAEAAMARTERLYNRQMVPASDWDRDRYTYLAAKATLAQNVANLALLKKGTWEEDLQVAQAAVDLAQAQVDSITTNLERLTARAPTDGEILQLNVRLGQFAAMQWKEPMIVLGDVNRLHVRADIDESDLPWFDKDAPAVATLKGRPQVKFPLTVVYIEPYVVPKQSLTGSNSERVDTRVLQVIYALPDERAVPLHVGQQMDVYMKAAKQPMGVELDPIQKVSLPFEEDEHEPAAPRSKESKNKPASRPA
jgi:multidrug resistance efflux pump